MPPSEVVFSCLIIQLEFNPIIFNKISVSVLIGIIYPGMHRRRFIDALRTTIYKFLWVTKRFASPFSE